ncbi:MAG: hypothetical protein WD042_17355 [Phycisphaeraceae bacterium]
MTAGLDGRDLRVLEGPVVEARRAGLACRKPTPKRLIISHPLWRDDRHVLIWSSPGGKSGYHLYHDPTGLVTQIGADVLRHNGHFTYHKDGKWLLTDTYRHEQTGLRELFLYDLTTGQTRSIAKLFSPDLPEECRCDLHPRLSPDGKRVCIDSYHQGERQVYLIDIGELPHA